MKPKAAAGKTSATKSSVPKSSQVKQVLRQPRPATVEPALSSVTPALDQHAIDNRGNQLNPNNDAYWQSRGQDARPSNWQQVIRDAGGKSS